MSPAPAPTRSRRDPGAAVDARDFIAAGLTPDVANWLARFQPKGSRRDAWPLVGHFVVSSIVALAPTGRPGAESFAWALTALAAWGVERGLEIDAEVLLHPD